MRNMLMKILLLLSMTVSAYADIIDDSEFGGLCVMGLAEGKVIKTDCDVTWLSDDNKTYCFQSEDAKSVFVQDSARNVERAKEFYAVNSLSKTKDQMGLFSTKEVNKFIDKYITDKTAAHGGVFPLRDAILGRDLQLTYNEIDFTRKLHGYGYFPSVKFHLKNQEDKKYLIDFWVKPENGKLLVMEERIYKAPRRYDGKWTLWMRDPRPWWWIPASEHPGETEEKKAWEVISAIESNILEQKFRDKGEYILIDEETGEKVSLEFVGVHQPVRRLKEDGRYFACTDFRKHGSTNEYYDIDFWLNEDDGSIRVGDVRIHKVPEMKDGGFVQIDRYNFDDLEVDIIP
ncbi:MAG: hypothetical protein COA63_002825 [Methylophaga sp.]|nr:hypothetical protein [Methylophaga sp.]